MLGVRGAVPGGVPDGCGYEFEVAVVQAGEGVAQADAGVGCEAGSDLEDAPLAAR